MSRYLVSLVSPQDGDEPLLVRELLLEGFEGRPGKIYYEIQRKFFEEACLEIPELRKLGISAVIKFISIKRTEGSLEASKEASKEAFGKKLTSLSAWQKVSKVSLERGLIPKVCPVCKNPPIVDGGRFLVIHHWGAATKLEAIRLGNYRRMCYSCNAYLKNLDLGWLYSGDSDWEGQYSFLARRFKDNGRQYPNWDGAEGEWSKFLPIENKVYEELLLGALSM